ncbi:MAG: competence protein ComEC family protein [Hyphomicrobium sp.]|uniref:ComEC/Rec2 family competence protein n=1 Tax=Hyphomicrobium sp. TaxID=82 RepID=UPI0025BA3B26|nr:ComEC/Rec2 family competence protein [Hyphomicrobium sp.]MBX9861315.1 competence protein ComEC family protein [Hyphomicrobium sp.]
MEDPDAAGAGGEASPAHGAADRARALAAWVPGPATVMEQLERERARWFVWLPVAFGTGIAIYFALPSEPALWTTLAVPAIALGLVLSARGASLAYVAGLALLVMSLGFAAAKTRTEAARAPVLQHELRYADVEGVVELIEPRPTRGERLTLRVISIRGLAADRQPKRIRIRAMRKTKGLRPGDTIRLRATLRPPAGPAMPGGYDFARTAWFQGLGATGFSLAPATIVTRPAEGVHSLIREAREHLERARHAIGERIRAAVPGETGAIAVSLITGERGGITEPTNDAYRDSGLVHILSISGLHMVIMAGFVFTFARIVFAAFPSIALRYPTKKWAAAAALLGAVSYLLISGASIATVRAALMIAIMFVAVMLDRQALAMRNVALAALLVLVVLPESLLDAGFQMSFAAVVSLIAAYEAVRERTDRQTSGGWLRPVAFFLGGIVLSTVIASISVAPFGVYHFHRSQQYALIANLIAVPICNLVIMPSALLTLIVMPLGLEAWPLALMAKGIDVMTATAYWVASLPGAIVHIGAIPEVSFALMVFGGLWLLLWQTRWRALGLVAIGAGILTAGGAERPDVLAGRGGALVAVRGNDGRYAVIGSRAGNYELTRWLERDGDGRPAREALRAKGALCDGAGCLIETRGLRIAVARHASATDEDCRNADILIGGPRRPKGCTRPRAVLDRWALRDDGTHAIFLAKPSDDNAAQIARIESVTQRRGARPWTERPEQRVAGSTRGERARQTEPGADAVPNTGAPEPAAPVHDDDDQ